MSSHGAQETERLKNNIQDQLSRLLLQLQDLEELRHELEDDEYEETRKDTIEQLEEFDTALKRLMEGDMTLVTELGQVKLAIRAAISNAFQTPEVIRSFARREPAALRQRLKTLNQDQKLGRINDIQYRNQTVEIIVALKKLGEELTTEEKQFLDSASADVKKKFETAEAALSETTVLAMAAKSSGGSSSSSSSSNR